MRATALLPRCVSTPVWSVLVGVFGLACEGSEKVIYVDREVPAEGASDTADLSEGDADGGAQDRDGDGYTTDDCDDDNPDVNPGTVETCNGIDDDCDGLVDDVGSPPVWYADGDGDGYGVASGERFVGCEPPDGFASEAGDCDDTRADVYPGAELVCEVGVDGDCDGRPDFVDSDSDGYLACQDCDDDDPAVRPGATEVCNGIDDDCDAVVDTDAVDAVEYFADMDGDGWGDDETALIACAAPSGHIEVGGDCDDADSAVRPDAEEVCDGIDNDCDRIADEADAVDAQYFYADTDSDGYGDPGVIQQACAAPSGFVSDASDCDDTDATISPSGTEVCGGVDEDCDGLEDDDDPDVTGTATWHADTDGDSYGSSAVTTLACAAPAGFVADSTDCDDTTSSASPAATELCDDIDNNCDGTIDEDSAADARIWYLDADSDAWGVATTTAACDWPAGYAAVVGDCDDTDPAVYPSASETWYDGVDSDCSGGSDYDADADGFDSDGYGGTDCDDTTALAYPGAPETWYDGIDGDCAGDNDYDADADGFDSDAHGGSDCEDGDATAFPGATDAWYDGLDQDCDGRSDYDADYDGFDSDAYGGTDCDDSDELVHPYAWEDDSDGADNDCDGFTDSLDPDVPIDLGLGNDDDGMVDIALPTGFSFPFCGTDYTNFYLNGNGLLTFDTATSEFYESVVGLTSSYAPAIAVFWDDFDLSDSTDANAWGIVYSDAVGVYFRNTEEYFGVTTNDFGVVLFDDGRVMWDFGSMSVSDGMVGWSCGTGSGDAVDWSTERVGGNEGLPTVGTGTEDAMYEQFSYSDPMDLGESTLWSCASAGSDLDGDGWTDVCGDPDDSDATVTP